MLKMKKIFPILFILLLICLCGILFQKFLLLLDADMVLNIEPNFKKEDLQLDSYSIRQKNPEISYDNIRLIRASLPWESIGLTHEHWSCMVENSTDQLHTLTIDDRQDGGCKENK